MATGRLREILEQLIPIETPGACSRFEDLARALGRAPPVDRRRGTVLRVGGWRRGPGA